ncbi:hypothetical protein [Pseudoduganella sp. R-43]|uniref:hypothetical protein n=1 Tax=unclassified Pseudoduganella TaxID=2637179 RepID=UPI003CF2EACE
MTAQIADRLINACPDLKLPGYQLFGIFTGAFAGAPSVSARDLMRERAAQREFARSATVRVLCAEDALFGLSKFSIYIDGNGHRTPPRLKHLASPSLEIIPVEPGKHRIVVREADVRKPDRAESNTEHFELASGEEAIFALQLDGEALLLKPLQPFVAAP